MRLAPAIQKPSRGSPSCFPRKGLKIPKVYGEAAEKLYGSSLTRSILFSAYVSNGTLLILNENCESDPLGDDNPTNNHARVEKMLEAIPAVSKARTHLQLVNL